MPQSRVESFVESWMNVLSGFFLSWGFWVWFVSPLYGIENDFGQSLGITCWFTVLSLVRSYAIRRWFNHGWTRGVKAIAKRLEGPAPSREGNKGTPAQAGAQGSDDR